MAGFFKALSDYHEIGVASRSANQVCDQRKEISGSCGATTLKVILSLVVGERIAQQCFVLLALLLAAESIPAANTADKYIATALSAIAIRLEI